MKATLDVKQLKDALAISKLAVNRRTTIRSMAGVLVESLDRKIILKSTNLQDYITVSIPSKNEELIKACIPYGVLSRFVSTGFGWVSIEPKGEKEVVIERPQIGEVVTQVLDAKDFPTCPDTEGIQWKTLEAKEFCRILSIVIKGCASDEGRPVLTAVLFKDGYLASADGFRLYAYKNEKLQFGLNGKEALVNRETVENIIKLYGKNNSVKIGFRYNLSGEPMTVLFSDGDIKLFGNLVQGHYPRYEQLIPASFNVRVSFSSPLMTERLETVDYIYNMDRILRMAYERKENKEEVCYLKIGVEGAGMYELSLPVKIESKETGKIAVNINYLKEAIKPFSKCELELTSPSSPMKITGDIQGLAIVVMPMFVQW